MGIRPARLVPTLREGDIVVLDKLSAHKDKQTQDLIEQAGAELRFLGDRKLLEPGGQRLVIMIPVQDFVGEFSRFIRGVVR
jgi:hypothetical protein